MNKYQFQIFLKSWLFSFDISENLAICSKDAQFLKYYNLIKDLPDEFFKKIQKCEIPRCHTNRYNSFDFLDTVAASNDTILETTHNFKIRASEVCKEFTYHRINALSVPKPIIWK